jgi:hypothetical protein
MDAGCGSGLLTQLLAGRLKETDRLRNTITDGLHHSYPDVT